MKENRSKNLNSNNDSSNLNKQNVDKLKQCDKEGEDMRNSITNNINNILKTFNTNIEGFDILPTFKYKTSSEFFTNKNMNNNQEIEDFNSRKEIPTDRFDDNIMYSHLPNNSSSHFSKIRQNMSFSNLNSQNFLNNKENSNNINTNSIAYTTNIRENNIANNATNYDYLGKYNPNAHDSSNIENNVNNLINPNLPINNVTFPYNSQVNNRPLNAEIAELESYKGLSARNYSNTNGHNNINLYQSNSNPNFANYELSITNELRLSNVERRLENAEKMLHFYDEMIRLKDQEKRNEARIDKNKITELQKKVAYLEESTRLLYKKLEDQNELIAEKTGSIDKKCMKLLDDKKEIGEYYASKLAEFENLYKKSEVFLETKIEEKFAALQSNFDSKLEDILNLINELTHQTDKNEFNFIESRESIRNIQNDHVDFLKIVTILKEKADTLDYVMEQITDLKHRYNNMINILGSQQFQEDDKIFNKMMSDNPNLNALNNNNNNINLVNCNEIN